MAYSTIDKPSNHFRIKLYTGDDTTSRSITFDESKNMQPDFTWIKSRSNAYYHELYDVVRGFSSSTNGRVLYTNTTGAEGTPNTFNSFNTNGFTVSKQTGEVGTNATGATFSSWSWKANGAGVSNTSGTITSTVSANTTSGFSIVSYTGNGNTAASVGHGLGVTPAMMIIKKRSATHEWTIWHKSLSSSTQSYLQFDTLAAQTSANTWGNTAPTSSLFYVGPASVTNGSSATFIAYCFAEVKGFSKFGSYTGNSSTDGTFVYTGFKPAYIMVKNTNYSSGTDWFVLDNKRNTYNVENLYLSPNTSGAEATGVETDFLSNGFKLRHSSIAMNNSSYTYIYMAFAESPFTSSKGIPTTAR